MTNKKKEIRKKKPWPTKDAMEQIYEMNLWGENDSNYYSGEGSHDPEIVEPYIDVITSFLISFEQPLTVCDLGCGDFNVGKELVEHTKKYVAVDIVEDLIERNKEKFKDEEVEFRCLNIAVDELPSGDCVLIRQVLQHLSNAEVGSILNKLSDYKYIIITEHIPIGDFEPNVDIISGQGTRLKKKSGLDVMTDPFNFNPKKEKELLSITLDDGRGIIVTTLYTMF
ncbi:MAG: class I SAM-dependent methyltransferase [Balneola sp.]